MKKKIVLIFVSVCLLFSLTSCSYDSEYLNKRRVEVNKNNVYTEKISTNYNSELEKITKFDEILTKEIKNITLDVSSDNFSPVFKEMNLFNSFFITDRNFIESLSIIFENVYNDHLLNLTPESYNYDRKITFDCECLHFLDENSGDIQEYIIIRNSMSDVYILSLTWNNNGIVEYSYLKG